MVQVICLANSLKLNERCIDGINPTTGKWIRPISSTYPKDGRVSKHIRLVNGKEPALLDVLEIPLEQTGSDFGFESENLTLASESWQQIGQVQPKDIFQYCGNYPRILHNIHKYVNPTYLQALPLNERRTLQLVKVTQLSVTKSATQKWKGTISTESGQQLKDASITDPVFIERLESGYRPEHPCLVTVSLSMPFRPFDSWEGEVPCWKLIAGVIELSQT